MYHSLVFQCFTYTVIYYLVSVLAANFTEGDRLLLNVLHFKWHMLIPKVDLERLTVDGHIGSRNMKVPDTH